MTQPQLNPLATPEPWDLVASAYAEEVMPMFTAFAREALRLAEVSQGTRVLDVACGPGTLSLLAAEAGARVDALDFSPEMIALLRQRAPAGVEPRIGDGQNLPYADASFDAAFSMFGLIFFPDPPRGLRELHRVLVPGGRAVISSWPPPAEVKMMRVLGGAMREALPNMPPHAMDDPFNNPDGFTAALEAAGFGHVVIHRVTNIQEAPSIDEVWASLKRTMAPLVLLKKRMGERFDPVAAHIEGRMREAFGEGPQRIELPAYLGVGTA